MAYLHIDVFCFLEFPLPEIVCPLAPLDNFRWLVCSGCQLGMGWIVRCKGWENDPDAYIYVIAQVQAFPTLAKVIGREDWLTNPEYNTPDARLPRLKQVFDEIEKRKQG